MCSIQICVRDSRASTFPIYIGYGDCHTFGQFRNKVSEHLKHITGDEDNELEKYLTLNTNYGQINENEFGTFKSYAEKYTFVVAKIWDNDIICDRICNIGIKSEYGNFCLKNYIISHAGLDLAPGLRELGYELLNYREILVNQELYDGYCNYAFNVEIRPIGDGIKSARKV